MEYPTVDQFQTFYSDVDVKLIENENVIVFIHLGAGLAMVLENHALVIKENNKHVLTGTTIASPSSITTRLDATRWMICFWMGQRRI